MTQDPKYFGWTPYSRLLRNLHTMSLVKATPDCLKDHKCKKMALPERPQIPYVPEKDSVQEMVSPKNTDQQRYRATSSYLALWYTQGFSHSYGICPRSDQEKMVF